MVVGDVRSTQVGSSRSTMVGGVPESPGCAVSPEHGFHAVALWQALVSTQPAALSAATKVTKRRTPNDTAEASSAGARKGRAGPASSQAPWRAGPPRR